MILDVIEQQIARMRHIQSLEEKRDAKQQQERTDLRYATITNAACEFVDAFSFACEDLGFSPSESLRADLLAVLHDLKDATSDGLANAQLVAKASGKFEALQKQMENEWNLMFPKMVSVTETLKVLEDVDPERVKRCLADIDSARAWKSKLLVLQNLHDALHEAERLISELRLNKEVITFLGKITNGTARLSDLDDELLCWIRDEGLEDRIRLSFAS